MIIIYGVEAHGGEVSECFYVVIVIGLTGSVLTGKPYFDNGDVVLQADIV